MKAGSITETSGPELVGARALRAWITGERGEYSRVFLLESADAVGALDGVAGDDDAILMPGDGDPYDGPGTVVRYRGALTAIGDELFLGERAVELQDYVAAAFIQIVGPTAVCLLDAASWRAFLDDADLARRTGIFPAALLDPRVLLANRSALADPRATENPRLIRVRADARVSVGLHGDVIGDVAALPTLLSTPIPRTAALGGVALAGAIAEDLAERAWVGRYLAAIDLVRMLGPVNGAVTIAGFGWTLLDDGRADAEPLTADPFLVDTPEGVVLADIGTRRRRLLSPATADVVALIQTSRTADVAADRVARRLRVSVLAADLLCREAVTALGVHLGEPADASFLTSGVDR